ncbi:MAG TPA: GyrI-like domain-containing protein [Phototrophicaceae bacterium]|nr:GyrI-like domain-containing protein [Phototrophicaceae bacterium]
MSGKVEIIEAPAQWMALIKTKTSPQTIGDDQRRCCAQVKAYLQAQGVEPAGHPVSFYYQMESPTVWTIGAGFPIAAPITGDEPVQIVEIPAGLLATLLHVGPYYGLKEAWQTLESWHQEQRYPLDRTPVFWESHLIHPDNEPDQSKCQARLYWLLSVAR